MAKHPVRNIAILTGSGVSAESGVATFRDRGGIWARYDYRDVATLEGFEKNPQRVHEFYNSRRAALPSVSPNAAHFALARLESAIARAGGNFTLITQNVDDLHERAGSNRVLHMHGEISKSACQFCGSIFSCCEDLSEEEECKACDQPGGMRPYVVWFGEVPRFLEEATAAILSAEMFVSIGTSGSVYPAAGFAAEARAVGVKVMELNLEPSENAYIFTASRYGPATEIVPEWVDEVIGTL